MMQRFIGSIRNNILPAAAAAVLLCAAVSGNAQLNVTESRSQGASTRSGFDKERSSLVEIVEPSKTSDDTTEPFDVSRDNVSGSAAVRTYLVGTGDVLSITISQIGNSGRKYLVRRDGTIDFGLAGDYVPVAGKTAAEIEQLLAKSIRIIDRPQIAVKIAQYSSHTVDVSGTVASPGTKYIAREAVPFFVLIAEACPLTGSNRAIVTRKDGSTLFVPLNSATYNRTLIYASDRVEFQKLGEVEIRGKVVSPQKIAIDGPITLAKLIQAVGGIQPKAKHVVIRRQIAGKAENINFELKDLGGKLVSDPVIQTGDVIEISE